MRKIFLSGLGMVVALSMCTTTAFAAGSGIRRNFIDTDGDGICDNINSVCIYADENGICEVCGITRIGCGRNFVDADGDGICDNYLIGQNLRCGYGRNSQYGRGNGFQGGRNR